MQRDAAKGVGLSTEQEELIVNSKGGAASGQPLGINIEHSPEGVESYHTFLEREKGSSGLQQGEGAAMRYSTFPSNIASAISSQGWSGNLNPVPPQGCSCPEVYLRTEPSTN